ncbi:MAG: hypothetical protein J6Z12_02800, partial [Paludibacteraceae bacterium]|nr:hypothetical protein [Paludibacteraceae bacterium]
KDEKCLKAQAFVMGYDMVVFNMSQNRWLGLTIRPVADPQSQPEFTTNAKGAACNPRCAFLHFRKR